MTVNSLVAEGVKSFSKNFANLQVGVPIAEIILSHEFIFSWF